jgi:hypothetical protein
MVDPGLDPGVDARVQFISSAISRFLETKAFFSSSPNILTGVPSGRNNASLLGAHFGSATGV